MTQKYKRRIKFIDKDTQLRLVFTIVPYLIIYTLVLGLVFFVPLAISLVADVPVEEQVAAAQVFLTLHQNIWPALLFAIAFIALHSLLVSHKIAGPIYRFERSIEGLKGGDLSINIHLRKGDYFEGLMNYINLMTAALREDFAYLKDQNEAAVKEMDNLLQGLKKGNLPEAEIGAKIQNIAALEKAIKERLEKYRLERKDG